MPFGIGRNPLRVELKQEGFTMLGIFNKQSKYTFKQLQPDGTTVTVTMTGTIPKDITPEAFRDAAEQPGAEVSVSQKRGKLKEHGRELSAKRDEMFGKDAVSVFDELLNGALAPDRA